MTNCEDIEDKSSQEYKDCLEKNKPIETEKIDQTAEQFEKDKIEKDKLAMLEIINRNRASAGLEPQDNSNTVYNPEDDENQLTETTITKDATDVSKKELKKRADQEAERQAIASGEKKLTFEESVKNSAANFLLQLKGVDDRAKWLWAYVGRLDAEMGYGGEGASEKWTKMMAESEAELQKLESQGKSTIGFMDLGGDATLGENILGGAAATINAISSFGASAVTSVSTLGVGLASDMVSGSVRDFNNQKAEKLGITVDELIETGQSEIMTPALIGGVGFALEKAGIKGVTKAINGMAIGPKRALVKVLNASSKEGGTEWLQTGLDEMNSLIAKGMPATVEGEGLDKSGNSIKIQVPNPELLALVWKKMGSKEGLESLLQGAVGGGVTAGGGRGIKKINRINAQANVRSSEDNQQISSLINDISTIEDGLSRTKLSPEDRKVFQEENARKRAELNRVQKKAVELVNELDDNQVQELNTNSEIVAETLNDINKIENNDTYTVNERSVLVSSLKEKAKVANQKVSDIKNEADLKVKKKNKKRELSPEEQQMDNKLNEIAEKAEANLKKQNKKAEDNLKKQNKKEKEVNDLAGERKDDGSYKTTKKEWDDGKSQQVIDKLFRNNTLQGLISSKIPFVKPPGFIEADFISASVEQLIPHIRGFNPEVNNSLSGWINSQLNNKIGNVFKKDEAGTKEKFETSLQTGKADGTSIDIADTSTTIEDSIDLKAVEKKDTAKAADKLRNITGITKEESTVQGDKIVGGKIRTEAVKGNKNPAKSDVGKAGTLLFGDQVIEAMGGILGSTKNKLGNYMTFLEIRGDDILSVLSGQNNLKNSQLSDLYKPNQVDREATAEGNAVMEYGNPNPKVADLIAWATDPKLAPTTLINRQRSLANILGSLLGRTSTVESIKTKTGKKKLVDTQELQGKKMKPDAISKLISDIDVRISDLNKIVDKYKGTLATGITPGGAAKVVIAGLKIIKKGLQAGLTFQKALTRGLEYIKKNLKSEAAADIISSEIQNIDDLRNKTEKELETLMEDVQDAIDVELELGKQNKQYTKDLNKLNIKGILDVSKFNFNINESTLNEIKSRRLNKKSNEITNDFIDKGKTIASAMPIQGKELFIDGKNKGLLQGLLGFQYRYVGSGKGSVLYDNISSKPASWVSKRTKDLFAALPKNIITANSLKIVQKKINEAKTKVEKIQIAKNNLAKIKQHQIDVDAVYYANQSLLSDYVYSAKNEKDLANKIDYVAKIKSTNTNNIQGDRALVKVNGFYIGPEGVKLKLEHVKTSSEQSIQGLEQILSGDIENSITNDFEGVYGFELDNKGGKSFGFSKIDKAGKTNTSQYYRFNNPIDAKNYILAEYDFEGTIADKNILSIVNDKKKADTTIRNGEQAIANDPSLIPTVTDPVVLDKDINKMIEDTKGIKARYKFSDIVAKRRGAGFKNFKIIPSSAQDFSGLMYDLYGKGRKGEQQQKWVKENLIKPYQKGIAEIDNYRQALKNDYSSLLKKFPAVAKKLGKIVPDTEFTFDQALRVNLWTEGGFEIPGLAKRDIKKLNDIVNKDPELKLFNQAALEISKRDKWIEPSAYWDSESLISDLNNLTNKVGRKQYLASFIENADVIFSKENLNKMEVALGTNWREAMEDSLYRMKNGTNRPSGTNKLTNQFNNWVNNSVGAIMFMNVKSALLQTISSVNFLNWSDNNPYKAALAFGNQKQYWSDFATLWNSPKLKQRRSGLRKDVNEAELANAAAGAKNKPQAILSYLLKIGFTPTQMADSFAIASGGATFYRNRVNTLKNQGLDQKAAEEQAFEDFAEASDVAQQSADPMLISQQQASPLGRLILAFQNTPAQVTRIFNKSARDFINGRGDQKTNVSKMIYYGAVQGLIFATLQNAAFALIPGFDDEEDEEKKSKEFDKKEERILNSMVDTMLRGSGVYGAIVSTLKNSALAYYREEKKDAFGKDHRNTLLEILNLSPPVGSKVRKINNAIKAKDYNKEVVKEQGWDVTLKGKVNLSPSYQVIASLTEAITNLPLERAVVEIDRIVEVLDARNTTFQRVALALGYRTWDVNAKNEERDLVKIEAKERKEVARKQKVIDDRAERKRLKELEKYKGKTKEEIKQMKRRDSIVDTNKSDQVKSLINLGLTKKEIKELKYEDDRVNKIIELTNK